MQLNLYDEIKKAIKDGLSEWWEENKNKVEKIHSLDQDGNKLLTVKQFCEKYPFISEGGMRHKLNFREWNGLNKCIANGTRRVLIKEKETLDWFNNPPSNANWTYDQNKYGRK